MDVDWHRHSRPLALELVRRESRWFEPLAYVPRHLFVPRWWERDGDGWTVRDGAEDTEAWMSAAYSNRTLVTRVGPLHADEVQTGTAGRGLPTSSSTLPGLVVAMYRHAAITDSSRVLVTTGSGYGTALACWRLGADQVTSVDVDPYLVKAASTRLAWGLGMHPRMAVCDVTGPLPGEYDRIVSTVSVRPVPVSWLAALRPHGRLVTTLAGTGLIITADRTDDGGAVGRVEPDPAGFMQTRHGDDYDRPADALWQMVRDLDGEDVSTSRYPLLYVPDAWDVWSMLSLVEPGIEHRVSEDGGRRTVWLLHADGSWARATATGFLEAPVVHQGGPRRLWDALERIRNRLNRSGTLPVYGARVRIEPDGVMTLSRGTWSVTVA
ncbi:protein-L-isoaspartate(D-aspartate) O-methyltransferase [Streptomyces longwoodensis]|uniref:protein-L-isoaspartate(D-aspartate) O-methyltransferase n=1 Tax=Streptomyces longwoodensis TaxID=68231 RepID=UPI00340005FA